MSETWLHGIPRGKPRTKNADKASFVTVAGLSVRDDKRANMVNGDLDVGGLALDFSTREARMLGVGL